MCPWGEGVRKSCAASPRCWPGLRRMEGEGSGGSQGGALFGVFMTGKSNKGVGQGIMCSASV